MSGVQVLAILLPLLAIVAALGCQPRQRAHSAEGAAAHAAAEAPSAQMALIVPDPAPGLDGRRAELLGAVESYTPPGDVARLADEAYASGDQATAARLYQIARLRGVGDPIQDYRVGRYLRRVDPQAALLPLGRAIKGAPDLWAARFELALAYVRLGWIEPRMARDGTGQRIRVPGALEPLDDIVDHQEALGLAVDPVVYFDRALLHANVRDLRAAWQDFVRAHRRLIPDEALAVRALRWIRFLEDQLDRPSSQRYEPLADPSPAIS